MNIMELFFNFLILLDLYWYLFPIVIPPTFYYVLIKIFAFPLASNKDHEFVIMAKPEKVKIKKIGNRDIPFFNFKQGLYWFSKPLEDVDRLSKYHVYIEGMNQSVTQVERRENKVNDIVSTRKLTKQLANHMVRLPLKIKDHFHPHWALTLDLDNHIAKLTKTRARQAFKINIFHSLGIYLQTEKEGEQEIEMESGQGKYALTAINTQTVIQQLQHIQEYSYYSSTYAFNLFKHLRLADRMFVTWLKGGLDPRIVGMLVIVFASVAVIILMMMVFGNPEAMLGPRPTE